MKTLTMMESVGWCKTNGIEVDAQGLPLLSPKLKSLRIEVPKSASRLAWFSRFVQEKLGPWNRCLLWVTTAGVWESSENWHLYYRLRQSYGDTRFLDEAPGHLFLEYEMYDLLSFTQLGLIAGWDMHLLPSGGHARAFSSHDGWLQIAVSDDDEMEKIKLELTKVELKKL